MSFYWARNQGEVQKCRRCAHAALVPDTESEERLPSAREAPLLPHPSPGTGSLTAHTECRGHQKNLAPDSARSRAILINSTSADDQLAFANARRVTLSKLAQAVPCDAINAACPPPPR